MQFLFLLNLARKLQRRVPRGFLKASHLQGVYASSRKPHGTLSTPTAKTSHNKKYVLTRGLLVASIMTMTACHSIQRVERPAFDVPQEAKNSAVEIVPSVEIEKDWWQSFLSPQLTSLIETAQRQNPDLLIASERVRQAELQMRIAGASLFPSFSINGSTDSGRSRFDGGEWEKNENSRVGLGASYEVDLWGRVSAGVAGARAGYASRQYDEAAAQLSVSGAVASAWFQWLTLQQRTASAEENIRIAERIAQIVQVRYDNGVATAADVSRQRTNLLSQQSVLLPLQLQARQTRAAIALLLGESPLTFELPADGRLLDLALPDVGEGIPADLLTRRPDLASVEAQLQAADADVAAARAALLPSVQLTASVARSSAALFSLSPPADSMSWSLGLAQTLFNGGRLRNQVKLSESQRVALVEQYRKSILTALQEVADAFDRRSVSAEQEIRQQEILLEAERTLRLIEARYREGSDDLLNLLESQRTVFQARDQLVQQRQARLEAAVDLYLALGGGWKVSGEQ
jgi:multidrug efflux system outer membrane protein